MQKNIMRETVRTNEGTKCKERDATKVKSTEQTKVKEQTRIH